MNLLSHSNGNTPSSGWSIYRVIASGSIGMGFRIIDAGFNWNVIKFHIRGDGLTSYLNTCVAIQDPRISITDSAITVEV